jgi:hypothetical protein
MSAPPARRVTTYQDREEWTMLMLGSSGITAAAKVTGTALKLHLNIETGQLNPSAKRIAELTVQSERGVLKHLIALKRDGRLDWTGTKGRTSNRYVLLIPTLNGGTALSILNPEQPDSVMQGPTPNSGTGLLPATLNGNAANPERGGQQPRTAVHPNLENQENLCAELDSLRREIGLERWHKHLWEGASIKLPKTILFKSRQHLSFALKHYQADFERLGYQATAERGL